MKSKKALFLDLDNTLITTKSGNRFPRSIRDWKFTDEILPAIKRYSDKGYIVIIISNQSAISAGVLPEHRFREKLMSIIAELVKYLNTPDVYYYYSISSDSRSYYRKPNPGMAYQAALDHHLDLQKSYMVGDGSGKPGSFSSTDRDFASNTNLNFIPLDDFILEYLFEEELLVA